MSYYEVWVTVWSEELGKQVKVVAGKFDNFFCARLFKEAYDRHFCTNAEVVEYVRK